MPKKKQPETAGSTSYDVAKLAGVSQSAVSRAFRKGASVAPNTRDRIMKAAKQLGYQPNAFARGLITKKTHLIAVIISNLTNLNYPEVLAELTQRLSHEGNRVLLFSLAAESDVDEVLEQVWPYRVDGAIVAARLNDEQIHQFNDRGIPIILYNRKFWAKLLDFVHETLLDRGLISPEDLNLLVVSDDLEEIRKTLLDCYFNRCWVTWKRSEGAAEHSDPPGAPATAVDPSKADAQ